MKRDITQYGHPYHDQYAALHATIDATEDIEVLRTALKKALTTPETPCALWSLEPVPLHTTPGIGDFEECNEELIPLRPLLEGVRDALTADQSHPCVHCEETFPVDATDASTFQVGYVQWCVNSLRAVLDGDHAFAWRCGQCASDLDQSL